MAAPVKAKDWAGEMKEAQDVHVHGPGNTCDGIRSLSKGKTIGY
jgi:hypothetical protein